MGNMFQNIAAQSNNQVHQVTGNLDYQSISQQAAATQAQYAEIADEVEREITDAEAEVSDWEKAQAIIQTSLTGLAEVAKAWNTAASANASNANISTTSPASSDELSELNTAIDNYKNKKNRNATTRATLESARGKAAIKSGKLGQDIAAKEATLNDETYKKDVDTIRKDMVAHNQAIQTGKETVEKCNTQITTITGAIEKIATAKTGNAEATNATQVTLTAEEKTKLGFEADVIELKTSEENQIKTIGQWQESYTACLGEINRLEGSVSSLQGTIDKMPDKDESGAENTAKAAKNEELRRVKQELDEKKNEKTKLEAQIQVGEKTLADIVKDRDAAQSSVAYSEKKMGELRTQLAQYVDIDKLLVSEQAEALRQQGVLGAASSNLNAQVDTLVSSYADTESFIADAEDARENKVKEVKAEIKDLKKEKAALDKAIAKADQLLGTQQQPEKPESNKQTTSGSFYGNDNKPLFNISDDGNLDDPAPNEDDDRYDEDGHRFKK